MAEDTPGIGEIIRNWVLRKRGSPSPTTPPADPSALVFEDLPENYSGQGDLLGDTSDPAQTGLRRERKRLYQRPPYETTRILREQIGTRVQAMSIDEIHRVIETEIPSSLLGIATLRMPLVDIPTAYWVIDAVRQRHQKSLVSGAITQQQSLDFARLDVASQLAYVVAFNEGLFGPNDLGYLPDTTTSLANKEATLLRMMERAAESLATYPDMFGEITQPIYEGVARRLNRRRAMFRDTRVNPADFPPFPTPKRAIGQ